MKLYKDLLQSMADHTSSVIYLKDLEGKYIFINKQHEKLFSIENSQIEGKTDLDIFPIEIAAKFRANDKKVLESGKVMELEELAPHEDGPHTYISVKFPVRDSEGKIFGVGGISTDITTRKNLEDELKDYKDNLEAKVEEKTRDLQKMKDDLAESRDRLELINHGLEHAGDAVFYLDLDNSNFVYVNQMACSNLGYTQEELLKMAVYDIDPDYQPENWPQFQKALTEKGYLKFESRHRKKDGEIFPVEIATHLINFQGKSYSIAFARNTSDRKKFEKELVEAKTAAEQANKAKSEFLSHMSHELRTPLNAVLGFTQLLELDKEKNLVPKQKDSIHQIRTAGNHLLELINDVLDLTLIETGSLKIFKEYVSVPMTFKKLIPVIQPLADLKNITIENHFLESEDLFVLADPTRLKQALLNLVTNAVKYNREGGRVTLKGERVNDCRVQIHVIDTGPGIEESKQKSAFDPFERLGAENSGIEGTGIGLTVTQKLVGLMDGTIAIKSDPGKGCCFTIELPAGKNSGERLGESPQSATDNYSNKNKNQCKKSILYIEDNPSSLKLIQSFIEGYSDFEFLSSPDATGGIKIARESQPSLILMDIDLPEIDGLTAFTMLKDWQETRLIPVIALSASAMEHEVKNALDMGFKDYIIKPVNLSYLMDAIQKNVKTSLP